MKFVYLIIFIFISACSTNVFDEFADKETSEAVFFEAKLRMNEQNYDAAVTLLESLATSDPSFLTQRERVPVYASAYSGRCGLIFLDLLNSLQNTGSTTILGTLMAAFTSSSAQDVADCMQAETIVSTNIGDESARNGDENLYMAFNSLAKVGAILSNLADTDNDDVADAGFSQCD
ncbi:MAG: hypothetical protein HRT44_09530, partial [Bdellovibrionales bacterium]|nr:hypothetical protein [Bdellovibrionales bacterium]NQZ19480.1 hypothetical protein [Bdellovibrionales bacterium]